MVCIEYISILQAVQNTAWNNHKLVRENNIE